MLSRVAERIYWQTRYLERAENTARLLNVFSNLLLDLPDRTIFGWDDLVRITGIGESFASQYQTADETNLARFLISDPCDVSISTMLAMARENARTVREVMPTEAFEGINELHYHIQSTAGQAAERSARNEMLEEIIENCQRIFGVLAGTMSRDAGYAFIRMGRALERADMVSRMVDAGARKLFALPDADPAAPGYAETYQSILWMNVLLSQSAYQMYRQHVRRRVNGEDVIGFLLHNEEFPRSVNHNLTTIRKVLPKLPNHGEVASLVVGARRELEKSRAAEMAEHALPQQVDDLQIRFAAIHDAIARTWFLPKGGK
ncbi:MAG: alpha-E domain-containing protein [Gammaproteobacteria bacterium]|nr:alpha-E domain-containing protein [Gammaproteobacteria bacterium]